MSAFGMLLQGKVGDAIIRVIETLTGHKIPQPIADLIHKFTSDAGTVIWNAAGLAIADVRAGKTLDVAAGEVIAQLETQGITAAKSDVLDALGLQLRASPTPAAIDPPVAS